MVFLMTFGIGLLALILIWGLFGPQWRTVPEEECQVVYRHGQFHRILDAGRQHIYSRFERIERIIDIREQPLNFPDEILIASKVVFRSIPAAFAVTSASQQVTRLAVAR